MSTGRSDEEAIRRTLALYCQLCDDGRFEEWGELYTDDATFTVMGRTHRGRAAVRAFIEKGQPPERRGKHVCANSVIDVDVDGDQATAVTDYVFVAPGADGFTVLSAGRYHDRLVRHGDGWRFAERRIAFLGDP
ncbi:MAG: nuclear transport factor 2 family protein [Actinomycetota bacterium]|nr:nuclear transport factor 2 family protein [Actinomycetota bacterium]